jgi:hypothetical protein
MKIHKNCSNIEKNREILTKDVNLVVSITDTFDEIISSKKLKLLILRNKKSKQFNKASSLKENKEEDENKLKEKSQNFIPSDLFKIYKKPEVNNCSYFDQGDLHTIGKFYTIFSEKDYIKDDLIILIKKVKNLNLNLQMFNVFIIIIDY